MKKKIALVVITILITIMLCPRYKKMVHYMYLKPNNHNRVSGGDK